MDRFSKFAAVVPLILIAFVIGAFYVNDQTTKNEYEHWTEKCGRRPLQAYEDHGGQPRIDVAYFPETLLEDVTYFCSLSEAKAAGWDIEYGIPDSVKQQYP